MNRVRVLLVDPYLDHAETLRMLLESRGCVVLASRDGHNALELIRAHRPDALIIDLDVLGARSVCKAAREANLLGTLLVGVAGVGVDPCDCEIVLLKPYRFEELVERMEFFLEQRARAKKAANGRSDH